MTALTDAQYSAIRGAAALDAADSKMPGGMPDDGTLRARAVTTIADILACVRANDGDVATDERWLLDDALDRHEPAEGYFEVVDGRKLYMEPPA